MRALIVPTMLAAFAALSVARPATNDLTFEEAFIRHCSNDPSVRAGALFHPRHPSETIWCVPNTRTFILLLALPTTDGNFPSSAFQNLLSTVATAVQAAIDHPGDGNIAGGALTRVGEGLRFEVKNANNHQLTWGVLGAAVEGLRDYMGQKGWAGVKFEVYDGRNMVGEGALGTAS